MLLPASCMSYTSIVLKQMNRLSWVSTHRLSLAYPTPCFKNSDISKCPIKILPSEDLSCANSELSRFLWPPNRAGHYILHLWFLLLLFFLAYSQLSQIRCLPCGLSVNLECRSEMCCTRLAENTGRKNSPKIHHLHTITQFCRAISSQGMYR